MSVSILLCKSHLLPTPTIAVCACFLTFNPVIEVSLAPEWLFPGLLSKKTRTVRNNNSPEINEIFDLLV